MAVSWKDVRGARRRGHVCDHGLVPTVDLSAYMSTEPAMKVIEEVQNRANMERESMASTETNT